MIAAKDFLEPAVGRGFVFWTGVPCSFLTPFINYVIESQGLRYVGAASEGEAVGIAAGAHLAGKKTVVMCQNSGFGNTVNPLTSLNYIFKIPTLFITTHRGQAGVKDEPQHELMGQITEQLFDTMRIPWARFPVETDAIAPALDRAEAAMHESGRPYAFIMPKGAVASYPLTKKNVPTRYDGKAPTGKFSRPAGERMLRAKAIALVREAVAGHAAIIGTTGKIGRELYDLGHAPNQLYVVGSMGCASGIGLGVALAGSPRPVVVLDGDGAALMKLGSWATIGHYAPKRFVHVVLDNEVHESTGAQWTVSPTTDFAAIASACGYRSSVRVDGEAELVAAVKAALDTEGPVLIHAKVGVGETGELGRPKHTPEEVKRSFMTYLAG